MSRILPERPDLDHLKHQAKTLLHMLRDGDAGAAERCRSVDADPEPRLANAQHVIAREYGFASWPKLKAHVESLTADPAEAFILAIKDNDAPRVGEMLQLHPELKAIINHGTDVLGFGATPLIAAVQRSNRDMVNALLTAGADLAVKSDWWAGGFSVLENAPDDMVSFLVARGAVIDVTAAAKFGMVDRLAEILAADPAAVQVRSGDGKTPLHWAKDLATARLLIEHGADVNARDIDHESTAAQYMVRDRQEIVQYLIERGSETDILLAAALGDIQLVREILDRDPRAIEIAVNDEYFPKQNPKAGGIIYIWTLGQGKTPHMVAQEFGHADIFALLMERSPDELQLAQACVLGDEVLFNRLLTQHPEIARSLPAGYRRKLLDAAVNNNTNAVRLMLRAGWPVAAKGPHGGTALHWAAWHGNAEMLREILKYNPPIDSRDNAHNIPPLGWALHGSLHGWHADTGDYAGVVTALIDAGADTTNPLPTLEGSEAALAAFNAQRRSP
jgi:ankyrin repeat protein